MDIHMHTTIYYIERQGASEGEKVKWQNPFPLSLSDNFYAYPIHLLCIHYVYEIFLNL